MLSYTEKASLHSIIVLLPLWVFYSIIVLLLMEGFQMKCEAQVLGICIYLS